MGTADERRQFVRDSAEVLLLVLHKKGEVSKRRVVGTEANNDKDDHDMFIPKATEYTRPRPKANP